MANEYWLIRTTSLTSDNFNAIKILGNTSGLPHQRPHWTSLSNNKVIIQADFSANDITYLQGLSYARKLGNYQSDGSAEQAVHDSISVNHWGTNGFNYYHESMGYISRTDAEIDTDLTRMGQKSNKRIKIYFNPYNQANLANCKNICAKAKTAGFYVIWNENNDNTTLTDANWSTYSDLVIADAIEAEDSGADEFLVGNEISIHNNGDSGFSDGTLPIRIKQLVTDCIGFLGTKSYQEGWWKKDDWNNAGLGSLSKIYFTIYETEADFETYVNDIFDKFGTNAIIGEWSTQLTMAVSAGGDEADWQDQLLTRQKILDEIGLTHFIFCYRDTGVNNNNMGFGLWKFTVDEANDIWNFL